MGKEGDLWDDSALVNAFDNAMSKYKIMHGKKNSNSSTEGGNIISNTEENVTANANESNGAIRRLREAEGNGNVTSNAQTKPAEVKNLPPTKENHSLDLHAPESYIDSSNGVPMQDRQDALKGYSYSQGEEDYNQLLSQYYELEEKRQKILQQLHQFGNWNYQYYGEGSVTGAQGILYSTSQENPIAASQASHPNVVCSCCPNICQCFMAPCTSYPACSLGETCVGKTCTDTNAAMVAGKPHSVVDGEIVQTAMGAAKRAISSMKMKTSINLNVNEDVLSESKRDACNTEIVEREEKEEEVTSSTSSETDLTVVLNAWYSAGFYTGKYLMEQSITKKRHC